MRRLLFVLGSAFVAMVGCSIPSRPLPSLAAAGPWTEVATAPVALTEVAVAAHGGRIWVAGGFRGDGTASDQVFVFDPPAGTWTPGPTLPEAVQHAAMVSTPDGLVLIGGYVGDAMNAPTAAVRQLPDGASRWTDETALPDPRAAGAAAFDGDRIIYAGGVGPGGVENEVLALDTRDGMGWQRIGRLPNAREHLGATSDGAGRTFVLGGRVGSLNRNLAVVDLIEGGGRTSVRTLGDLPTKRGGVAAFWWPSLGACLAGGESPGGTNPQVECMAADGTLAQLPDLGHPRHGLGAAVIDGAAYIVLGGPQPGLFASDITEVLRLP